MCSVKKALSVFSGGLADSLFGGGSSSASTPEVPEVPPPAEPLKNADAAQIAARNDVRKRQLAAQGMASTNKTGGLGLPGPAQTTGKSLLGQ